MTEKKKRHLHLVGDDTQYKDYAMAALDEAIYDAITSEADEYDIYNTIMNSIRKRGNDHEIAAERCKKLSDLLDGVDIKKEKKVNYDEPSPPYNPKEWD